MDSRISSKLFSVLSGLFILLTIAPLWNDNLFTFFISINIYFPFYFGCLAAIIGWFGVKGGVRGSLLVTSFVVMIFT